jgi:pimeloyl-ACP methyl ester carboxylesterase
MEYSIVKVITSDNLELYGNLVRAKNKENILINIHGTASSFYIEGFEQIFCEELPKNCFSVLFTNNRGNYVMESWQNTGAALEIFEDCVIDIDTWIEFVLKKGYKNIFLQGHSLGTEKVVYYMNKGKYRDCVRAIILLGFSDSFGSQMRFLKENSLDNSDLLNEAKLLVKRGKPNQFLTSTWLSHAGVLPQSAASYINFFSPNSELSKTLPLRNNNSLVYFHDIKVPILAIISDRDIWTIITPSQAAELLKKENPKTLTHLIKNTNHSFKNKEKEAFNITYNFLSSF